MSGIIFCRELTSHPVFRSEGPSQVFLLVLSWLTAAFGHLSRSEWQKVIVSYDNMCHLDNLKVARKPLPLPDLFVHVSVYRVEYEMEQINKL